MENTVGKEYEKWSRKGNGKDQAEQKGGCRGEAGMRSWRHGLGIVGHGRRASRGRNRDKRFCGRKITKPG